MIVEIQEELVAPGFIEWLNHYADVNLHDVLLAG
jgi:hypothetical protein